MTKKEIEESTRAFMVKWGFDAAYWDGIELTCYILRNTPSARFLEPFGITEFNLGTPIENAWSKLWTDLSYSVILNKDRVLVTTSDEIESEWEKQWGPPVRTPLEKLADAWA